MHLAKRDPEAAAHVARLAKHMRNIVSRSLQTTIANVVHSNNMVIPAPSPPMFIGKKDGGSDNKDTPPQPLSDLMAASGGPLTTAATNNTNTAPHSFSAQQGADTAQQLQYQLTYFIHHGQLREKGDEEEGEGKWTVEAGGGSDSKNPLKTITLSSSDAPQTTVSTSRDVTSVQAEGAKASSH